MADETTQQASDAYRSPHRTNSKSASGVESPPHQSDENGNAVAEINVASAAAVNAPTTNGSSVVEEQQSTRPLSSSSTTSSSFSPITSSVADAIETTHPTTTQTTTLSNQIVAQSHIVIADSDDKSNSAPTNCCLANNGNISNNHSTNNNQQQASKYPSHNNNNNNNNNIINEKNNKHQVRNQASFKTVLTPTSNTFAKRNNARQQLSISSTTSDEEQNSDVASKKCRRLSYVQVLFLRKWPFLAIALCTMASLCFAILISTLTVYLLHTAENSECSSLASRLSQLPTTGHLNGNNLLAASYELRRLEVTGGDVSALTHSALLEPSGSFVSSPPIPDAARLLYVNGSSSADLALTSSNDSTTTTPTSEPNRLLPKSVEPIHYELFVQPYLREPFVFDGRIEIHIKCLQATRNITLHTNELTLNEKTLKLQRFKLSNNTSNSNSSTVNNANNNVATSNSVPKIVGLKDDRAWQFSIIELDSELQANAEYLISVDFVGQLNNDLAGFYKIKYKQQQQQLSATTNSSSDAAAAAAVANQQTDVTWIAATQFQPTDARRAFPCFDEPIYKATFGIKIKHWKNMTALSNMPIVESEDSADKLWVTDTFAKSARMSTYLVAFAVTNFESRSEGNISVWTRPGLAHTAEYSLKIAGKILRHYEDFFGTKFPLPKMDMIALPDFNAGAMENWGLITYRETAMLYDSKVSTVANKERVATVVAHELAHQWFGNLVTPKWWDDLWLNEGFASYVEYIGVDYVEPQWRMMDVFVIEEMQSVLGLDSLSSSHKISIPVNRPDEIHEIFDSITYAKGASIIRMMNAFLTDKVFKLGLQRYLSALKYSNAAQHDLWQYLTEAQQLVKQDQRQHLLQASPTSANSSSRVLIENSNQDSIDDDESVDVERVMNSWTLQSGFPLITLTREYNNDGKPPVAYLQQQPFVLIKPNLSNQTINSATTTTSNDISDKKWEVPVTFTWKSKVYENITQAMSTRTKVWLHQNDTTNARKQISANKLPTSNDDWILLNIDQVGYYRVNYDLQNWRLLVDQLTTDHKKIKTTNRAQLVNDMFELARNSMLDYEFVMNATKYLKHERAYLPWYTATLNLHSITSMLERTPIFGLWKKFVGDVMEPRFERLKNVPFAASINANSNSSNALSLSPSVSNDNNEDEANNDLAENFHQTQAMFWLCKLSRECQTKAKQVFDEWKATKVNTINKTLRKTIYCTAIEVGDESDWNFLWSAYQSEQSAIERDRMLRALTCSRDAWILNRYLEWAFDKTQSAGIRRQDGTTIFNCVANNRYNHGLAFQFLRQNWRTILEMFGHQSFGFSALVQGSANGMNTRAELEDFKRFHATIGEDAGSGKRAYLQTIEEIETNVAWKDRYYNVFDRWLKREYAS